MWTSILSTHSHLHLKTNSLTLPVQFWICFLHSVSVHFRTSVVLVPHLAAIPKLPRIQLQVHFSRTCPICTDDIEDEYHFLFKCTNNKKLRNSFFEYLSETLKEFHEKNEKDKIILLFHSKNKQTINKFAKFVYQSFQAKSLTN